MRFIARMTRKFAALVVGLAVVSSPGSALAQSVGARRLALVIGNSAYLNVAALRNPRNDANDLAIKLKSLKFEVTLLVDANRVAFEERLAAFAASVRQADTALVFYAGHGVTVNRESFLLPIDVPGLVEVPNQPGEADGLNVTQLVSMATLLAPLQKAKIGIVFLDACRSNATSDGLGLMLVTNDRSTTRSVAILRGTASTQIAPSPHSAGVFRAYATQLDNVASDGSGRNSPFTRALLKHIGTPGLPIQEIMIRVRRDVMSETGGKQVPWEEAALNESFFFVPTGPASSPATTARPSASTAGANAAPSSTARTQQTQPRPSGGGNGGAPQRNSLPPSVGVGVGMGL